MGFKVDIFEKGSRASDICLDNTKSYNIFVSKIGIDILKEMEIN
jgi:hypothetical protein